MVPETQKCEYPTTDGAPCQNDVSAGTIRCAAGHPVVVTRRAGLGSSRSTGHAVVEDSPTIDAELVFAEGLPVESALRHEAAVDMDIAKKHSEYLVAVRELHRRREYSISSLHALVHNYRYRSGKGLEAEREQALCGDLDMGWRNAQKNPPQPDELIAHLSAVLENEFVDEKDKQEVAKILDKVTAARDDTTEGRQAYLNAEEKYQGWSRFFLVTNTGGHIHSSMACSTCRPTTSFGWLPELSGLDEKAAVDAEGARLCSVCFPDAPVEWQEGYYAQQAAAKAAAKCAGSGTSSYEGKPGRRYQKCMQCGEMVTITSRGLMRAHKPKKS